MVHEQSLAARSHGRSYRAGLLAAALVAAASLGGCADTSGFASAATPYQVAGPTVAKTPALRSQSCDRNANGYVDQCNGFPYYQGE